MQRNALALTQFQIYISNMDVNILEQNALIEHILYLSTRGITDSVITVHTCLYSNLKRSFVNYNLINKTSNMV
jgi:hypothetical protein